MTTSSVVTARAFRSSHMQRPFQWLRSSRPSLGCPRIHSKLDDLQQTIYVNGFQTPLLGCTSKQIHRSVSRITTTHKSFDDKWQSGPIFVRCGSNSKIALCIVISTEIFTPLSAVPQSLDDCSSILISPFSASRFIVIGQIVWTCLIDKTCGSKNQFQSLWMFRFVDKLFWKYSNNPANCLTFASLPTLHSVRPNSFVWPVLDGLFVLSMIISTKTGTTATSALYSHKSLGWRRHSDKRVPGYIIRCWTDGFDYWKTCLSWSMEWRPISDSRVDEWRLQHSELGVVATRCISDDDAERSSFTSKIRLDHSLGLLL